METFEDFNINEYALVRLVQKNEPKDFYESVVVINYKHGMYMLIEEDADFKLIVDKLMSDGVEIFDSIKQLHEKYPKPSLKEIHEKGKQWLEQIEKEKNAKNDDLKTNV